MQNWRRDAQASHRVNRKRRATRGAFSSDARRYLAAVTAMPSYKERVYQIGLWVTEFGDRQRDSLQASDIRAVRDRWLTQPRKRDDPRPLSPHTVNLRLRALSNLYRVLDGRRAENPVREVDEAPEPDARPRALSYEVIEQVLAALPDRGRAGKGDTRPKWSQTRIRLRCLAFCQITPKQLKTIMPADLDLTRERLRLPARGKGKGSEAIWVPLVPAAVEAFRDLVANGLCGPFSWGSLSKSWHRAVKAAGLPRMTPYQLRHTFGTLIYRATRSRDAVQQLMQHASWKTSRRYTLDAEDDVRAAHAETVADALAKLTK